MFSVLTFASSIRKANRIAALSLSSNVTFQSKKSISLKYSEHPLFLSNQMNSLSSLTISKTKFLNSFAPITQGYFRNLNIKNCVFADSKSPVKALGNSSLYTKTITNRTVVKKFMTNIYFTKFLRCGSESSMNPEGGAIFTNEVQIVIAKCLFDSCAARFGGAIYLNSSTTAELKYVHFSGCTGTNKGGAIFMTGSSLSMDMCIIAGCNADQGGAIFGSGYSILRITNGSIYNNKATKGAALRLESSSVMMFRVFYTNNNCTKEKNDAVEIMESQAYLEEVMFTGNSILENGTPAHLKFEGGQALNMTHCCIPENTKLSPVLEEIAKNSSNLKHTGECMALDSEIPEAEENIDYFFSIKNSTNTMQFFLAIVGVIAIPIIIMSVLPFLFSGAGR